MKWKFITIGLAGGAAIGYALARLQSSGELSPEKALQQVKKAAKKELSLDGAWIYLTPQPFNKNHLSYNVYKGGLTAKDDGGIRHYDFVADAKTGTVLNLEAQS